MSRIGVCVICFPAHKEGKMPLGMVGINKTTGQHIVCKACNGKGYAHFRSDKEK